jgi:hypothetical protein
VASADDTHPSGIDRFLLTRSIKQQNKALQPEGLVWDLFTDRESLTAQMSHIIDLSMVRDLVKSTARV